MAHSQQKHLRTERLFDEIHSTERKTYTFRFHVLIGCKEYDRYFRYFTLHAAQFFHRLKSVHAGHFYVKKNKVGDIFFDIIKQSLTGLQSCHIESRLAEYMSCHLKVCGIVIDYGYTDLIGKLHAVVCTADKLRFKCGQKFIAVLLVPATEKIFYHLFYCFLTYICEKYKIPVRTVTHEYVRFSQRLPYMISEFCAELLVFSLISAGIGGQHEHDLAGGAVITDNVTHHISVNIRKRLAVELQRHIRYRAFAEDSRNAVNVKVCLFVIICEIVCAVQSVSVLSVSLDRVERLICQLYKRIVVIAVIGYKNSAYGSTEGDLHIVAHKSFSVFQHIRVYLRGYFRKFFRAALFRTECRKLVAAEPCASAAFRKNRSYDLRKAYQHLIARFVTVNIIHQLEGVEVDHQQTSHLR